MIGIIVVGDIKLSPFSKKYTDVFDEKGIEYEIIHWNREGGEAVSENNVHTFSCRADRFGSKLKRVMPYIKFSRFARRKIKERKYEKLVVLTTQTAFILFDVLMVKYRKKYYFDYRDTSYEYIGPYSFIVNKIFSKAQFAAVSSPGFLEYIKTKTETFLSHNFQNKNYSERKMFAEKNTELPIVMGYVGVLREYDYLVKLADTFGADKRFKFVFYGAGDDVERLREYCSAYDNVLVMGAYAEKDKPKIIEGFDMICYNYPYSFVNYPAVANKLYDGLIYKKPMFSNSRTYSGRLVAEKGFGISIDQDCTDTCQKIFDYYNSFDESIFAAECEKYLGQVIDDEGRYRASIEKFADKTV